MSLSFSAEYIRDHAQDGFGPSTVRELAERVLELEEALAGLRDLCEQAGMPCDRANALLPKNPDDYEGEDEFFRAGSTPSGSAGGK